MVGAVGPSGLCEADEAESRQDGLQRCPDAGGPGAGGLSAAGLAGPRGSSRATATGALSADADQGTQEPQTADWSHAPRGPAKSSLECEPVDQSLADLARCKRRAESQRQAYHEPPVAATGGSARGTSPSGQAAGASNPRRPAG